MNLSRGIDIIIPFHRNTDLVEPLFESLRDIREELCELACSIVVINDSPEDPEFLRVLADAIEALSASVPCHLIRNERNLGFVGSVNSAARRAVESRRDVLLLTPDTVVFPDALREIYKVACADPLVGFVSPRSNNGAIGAFPHQEEFRHLEPKESYAVFDRLCRYLPEFQFVPTAAGFCMFVKLEVLEEFGYFDEDYRLGDYQHHDLIMRANRC